MKFPETTFPYICALALIPFALHMSLENKKLNTTPGKITRYTCSDYFEPDAVFDNWDSCEVVIYRK